jgi:predicted glutamine amidotransferase
MCRILVVVNPTTLPPQNMIKAISTLAEDGNTDACGFAVYKTDGRWGYVKAPLSCFVFAEYIKRRKRLLTEILDDTLFLMFHARKATKGEPEYNPNNHPFCYEPKKLCLIHNGSVNRKETSEKKKREDEIINEIGSPSTDSAMLLARLVIELENSDNLLDAATKAFSNFYGKASVAVATPTELVYTKNSLANIYLARLGDTYIMATAKDTMKALGLEVEDSTIGRFPRVSGRAYKAVWITLHFEKNSDKAVLKKELYDSIIDAYETKTYYYYYPSTSDTTKRR